MPSSISFPKKTPSTIASQMQQSAATWVALADKDGNLVSIQWDREFCQLVGVPENNTESLDNFKYFCSQIHPEDAKQATKAVQEVLADPTMNKVYDSEFRVRLGDGKMHWVRDMGRVSLDPQTGGKRLVAVATVVDDYKNRESLIEEASRAKDEEIASLAQNEEILKRQVRVASALSREYTSLWYVAISDMKMRLMQKMRDGANAKAVQDTVEIMDYQTCYTRYAESYVVPEDREAFIKAVMYDTVRRRIHAETIYRVPYRRLKDGKVEHYQICYTLADSESGSEDFLLGFRDVNEQVIKERTEREFLESQMQRVKELNCDLEASRRKLEHQARITIGLSREYSTVWYVSTTNRTIHLVHQEGVAVGAVKNAIESTGRLIDYDKSRRMYADSCLVSEDREHFLKETSIERVVAGIHASVFHRVNFRRQTPAGEEFYQTCYVQADPASGSEDFLVGFRSINDEVSIERKKREVLEEQLRKNSELNTDLERSRQEVIRQLRISNGLAREYACVWYVKVPEMKLTLVRDTGAVTTRDAVAATLHLETLDASAKAYAEHHVFKEDRAAFLAAATPEAIRNGLAHQNLYRVNYRRESPQGIEYYQACFVLADPASSSEDFLIGFRNIDEQVRSDRQRQEALETALESAQRASRAKTLFLNNISHDIRTPMNGIIGMTAIAGAHLNDSQRVKDCLSKISVASAHLLSLINDVLDISRIESGKTTLTEENFSLPTLFSEMLTIIQPTVAAKSIDLSIDIRDVHHEHVIGDAPRLQQVFLNIIGNAVKFTQNKGRIHVQLTEKPTASTHYASYEFVCTDTGCGMKPEFIDRIFIPFERSEDALVNRIPGTGLGMSIARNIVRMMDGDIKVDSVYGKGSAFTVTFRIKTQDEEQARRDVLRDLSVLVVDDDEAVCESSTLSLSELGMVSEYVLSGQAAVERVKKAHDEARDFNVCLVDWQMPGMDGIETTRAIRRIVGSDVSIIIISAFDWSDIEDEARLAGADGFIEKPLFKSRLDAVISGLVSGHDFVKPNDALQAIESVDFSGKRILLAEDNSLNQEIAVEILQMAKAEVVTADNGREAVEIFEREPAGAFDLILMDIQMPVLDGNAAAQIIRASAKPDANSIPIIAMSANAFAEDRESARSAGMNDYLTKPVNFKKMFSVVGRYLKSNS